jgi:hypothetical protein
MTVFIQWMWTFITGQLGSRLILDLHRGRSGGVSETVTVDATGSTKSSGNRAALV